jgi:hypothetical protein
MAESETSPALHNGSSAPQAIGAALGGPSRARKAAPTPTPMAPHGYTLQFLISIIKDSQQRNSSQQNE